MSFLTRTALAVWLIAIALFCDTAHAAVSPADPLEDVRYEAMLREELSAKAPDLVGVWDRANADRDAGRKADAQSGYQKIIDALPSFDHAHRRLCSVESDQDRAVAECRKALSLQPRWENHLGLAARLAMDKERLGEARAEAAAAQRMKREEPTVLGLLAQLDLAAGDVDAFRTHYGTLKNVAPEHPGTIVIGVLAALVERDASGARAALARAKERGFLTGDDEASYEQMIDRVDSAWTPERIAKTLAMSFGLWLAAIITLFAIGSALSKATLRHTEVAAARESADVGGTRALKRLYRFVITLAGVVYWLSLPFVAVLVIGCVGGVIYLCLAAGRIPIKLVLILLVIGASSVWALLKSVVISLRKSKDEDPGEALPLEQHPRLASLLAQVSSRVGTRTVDRVFLTPGTEMAVYERGGALSAVRGGGERCLIMGAGVLRGLQVGSLKGVLAHEFGHFKNEDTAGGALSLSVRRSMMEMLLSLIRGGAAAWYNPAWLFATQYHRIFLRISQGASRLQEVLADRWAVLAYGSEPFVTGFEHVIRRSIEHDSHVQSTLDEVTSKNHVLANLFTYVPETPADESERAETIREALDRDAGEFDSHPSPRARIALARALAAPHRPEAGDDDDAWSLLENGEALEARLTEVVCENVARAHGIVIRRAA